MSYPNTGGIHGQRQEEISYVPIAYVNSNPYSPVGNNNDKEFPFSDSSSYTPEPFQQDVPTQTNIPYYTEGLPNEPIQYAIPSENEDYTEKHVYVFTTYATDALRRSSFIRKVYSILFLQLCVTFGATFFFLYVEPVNRFVKTSLPMLISAFVLFFVLLIFLTCIQDAARTKPWNYLILCALTLVESYLVGVISCYYSTESVAVALLMTLVVTIGLTLFAWQTKYDFTGWGPYMLGILLVLITFGFINIFFCFGPSATCRVMRTLYAAIGAIIFSLYCL